MKKELWQKIIHFAITILTAIATTLGTTSCIGLMQCPHTTHRKAMPEHPSRTFRHLNFK